MLKSTLGGLVVQVHCSTRALCVTALAAAGIGFTPAHAQQIPTTPAEVARPGGTIPGAPKLALVKVADGFIDPVGVTAANDGSGRIFVVERIGRIRVVGKDGKVAPSRSST